MTTRADNTLPVLLLASESGDGQYKSLIDPRLSDKLAARGIDVFESLLTQLHPRDLECFAAVVLMRSPIPGHPKDDSAAFAAIEPALLDYVRKGGGLILMFSESYGKTVASLNSVARHFDLQFAFNHLSDTDPAHCSSLPNMPEGRLLKVRIDQGQRLVRDLDSLFLCVDGGHGTQALTCLCGSAWQTILQGFDSCVSSPYPDNLYAASTESPVSAPTLCAWRDYGRGRVVAFPESAAFWLANAYLPRWRGALMEQQNGAGLDFTTELIRLSTAHAERADLDDADRRLGGRTIAVSQDYSFRYLSVTENERLSNLAARKIWIGVPPKDASLADVANAAVAADCRGAVVLFDYDSLDANRWQDLWDQCDALSSELGLQMQPGFEMFDAEGNWCVVFNVRSLPVMRRSYANSNMLEDLLVKLNAYSAIFARPTANRIPAWRHGGYNLLEVDGSDGTLRAYQDRIASNAFLSPIHVARNTMPSSGHLTTQVLVSPAEADVLAAVRENRHFSFVSSGPILEEFRWDGGRLIDDDWEGLWMEWDDGDVLTIRITLSSDVPLDTVTLYDAEKVYREWHCESKRLSSTLSFTADHDMRLHLTARDQAGRKLIASYPLYSRCRTFWAHMGSDQMNDYHNVWVPDPQGKAGIGEQFYESYGFVTVGYGWGDYVRITPPFPWRDIMPHGVEVSSLVSSFQSFHPSPFMVNGKDIEFLNNHHRALGRCTSQAHAVKSIATGAWLEQDNAIWCSPLSGNEIRPTRTIRESRVWSAEASYQIPKWPPYGPCEVIITMRLTFLSDVELRPGHGFSIGHSLHIVKPGLALGLEGAQWADPSEFLRDGTTVATERTKEWDNLSMVRLLASPLEGSEIEIPAGCSAGTCNEEMGNFRLRNDAFPGRLFMRGWQRNAREFALDFVGCPEQQRFAAGDMLEIAFSLCCIIPSKRESCHEA